MPLTTTPAQVEPRSRANPQGIFSFFGQASPAKKKKKKKNIRDCSSVNYVRVCAVRTKRAKISVAIRPESFPGSDYYNSET